MVRVNSVYTLIYLDFGSISHGYIITFPQIYLFDRPYSTPVLILPKLDEFVQRKIDLVLLFLY